MSQSRTNEGDTEEVLANIFDKIAKLPNTNDKYIALNAMIVKSVHPDTPMHLGSLKVWGDINKIRNTLFYLQHTLEDDPLYNNNQNISDYIINEIIKYRNNISNSSEKKYINHPNNNTLFSTGIFKLKSIMSPKSHFITHNHSLLCLTVNKNTKNAVLLLEELHENHTQRYLSRYYYKTASGLKTVLVQEHITQEIFEKNYNSAEFEFQFFMIDNVCKKALEGIVKEQPEANSSSGSYCSQRFNNSPWAINLLKRLQLPVKEIDDADYCPSSNFKCIIQ